MSDDGDDAIVATYKYIAGRTQSRVLFFFRTKSWRYRDIPYRRLFIRRYVWSAHTGWHKRNVFIAFCRLSRDRKYKFEKGLLAPLPVCTSRHRETDAIFVLPQIHTVKLSVSHLVTYICHIHYTRIYYVCRFFFFFCYWLPFSPIIFLIGFLISV